jgi:hypothetical protein
MRPADDADAGRGTIARLYRDDRVLADRLLADLAIPKISIENSRVGSI